MDFLSMLQGGVNPQATSQVQQAPRNPQQTLGMAPSQNPQGPRPLQMTQPTNRRQLPGRQVTSRQLQPTGQVMDIADEGGAWNPQVQQGSAINPIQGGGINHQGYANPLQGGQPQNRGGNVNEMDPMAILRSLLGL